MNSIILTFICGFWELFKKSGIYTAFDKIYSAVSRSFKNSLIVSKINSSRTSPDFLHSSILYNTADKIFSLAEFMREKCGKRLVDNIQSSIIISALRGLLHSFYALNIRVFGVIILSASIVCFILKYILFSSFIPALAAAAAVGTACIFADKNIADYLNYSAVISFVTKTLGLEINYTFYRQKETKNKGTLIAAAAVGIAAGAAAAFNIKLGIVAVPAVFALLCVFSSPVSGVYFAVISAPFVPTMALAGICMLSMLSLFLRSLYVKTFRWRFEGIGFGLIMLLAIFFITSFTSFAQKNSLMVWTMYFIFMSFYFVVLNSVKTLKQLDGLIRAFIISGFFVAAYGVMQYVFGWNTTNAWIDENMFEDATMRVYSTLGNPNVLGEYLLLVLPMAGAYMCIHRRNKPVGLCYLLITLCLFVCLILTQSRGCWLGFLLSAMIFVTFFNGRLWGLLPIVLIILPFIVPQTVITRISSIGNMDDSSTSYRVFIWLGTLALLRDFWIGGIGMGEAAFNSVYPFYSYNAIIAPHSHNLYLQLITESGIAALVVFIVIMLVYIKNMTEVYSYGEKESRSSIISLASISGVIGFLLQSMTDYTFYNYRVMAIFFMYLAMGISLKYFTVGGNFHDKNSRSIKRH